MYEGGGEGPSQVVGELAVEARSWLSRPLNQSGGLS